MNIFNFAKERSFSKLPLQDVNQLKSKKLDGFQYVNDCESKPTENELFTKNLYNHFGCVNAIEFSNNGNFITSGGDDKRVLLWNLTSCLTDANPKCRQMTTKHESNIFSVAVANQNDFIYSAGNDCCVIRHDAESGKCASTYRYEKVIYCLSVKPDSSHVFASACENSRVIVQDIRISDSSCTALELISDMYAMHGVAYNPLNTQYIATANSFAGVHLWDVRNPKKSIFKFESHARHFDYEYNLSEFSNNEDWNFYKSKENQNKISSMSVTFDTTGQNLLVLRRRGFPVIYQTGNTQPKHIFIDRTIPGCESKSSANSSLNKGYINSCTMKSGCFFGCNDEFIVSGSDDFGIYIWKIPDNLDQLLVSDVHAKLTGHRSIPNQARFDSLSSCLISSGVEKIIKMWSGFPLNLKVAEKSSNTSSFHRRDNVGANIDAESISFSDVEETTEEDSQLMALFDSLISQDLLYRREIILSRDFLDIYENYDPMMDTDDSDDSDESSHLPNYQSAVPILSDRSDVSNYFTNPSNHLFAESRSQSPASSFDPELDNNNEHESQLVESNLRSGASDLSFEKINEDLDKEPYGEVPIDSILNNATSDIQNDASIDIQKHASTNTHSNATTDIQNNITTDIPHYPTIDILNIVKNIPNSKSKEITELSFDKATTVGDTEANHFTSLTSKKTAKHFNNIANNGFIETQKNLFLEENLNKVSKNNDLASNSITSVCNVEKPDLKNNICITNLRNNGEINKSIISENLNNSLENPSLAFNFETTLEGEHFENNKLTDSCFKKFDKNNRKYRK